MSGAQGKHTSVFLTADTETGDSHRLLFQPAFFPHSQDSYKQRWLIRSHEEKQNSGNMGARIPECKNTMKNVKTKRQKQAGKF